MRSSETGARRVTRIPNWRPLLAAAAVWLSVTAHAHDLGIVGPVYPIAEVSLLEVVLAKLREAQASGRLAALERDAKAKVIRAIEEPTPIASVTKTTRARTFHFDPSLVVPYAITDAEGKVIVAPGTRVNPLDTVSLSKQLLFFDARDAGQVTRAEAIFDEYQGKVKLILTGGSYLDLVRRWKRPVYFDQHGQLVERLGIRHVPAIVSQDGKRLRIDEIL